ncbi:ATP-binding protein [Desulforhopalus singaporensis]|uniref:Histidine kinase-, DNA gyrase B-, and HSP90-like ATPase n=1 Tax=Desulforhopalus singaporensis TaxID=91360 RepID=A0A1H0VWU3_9BACT|nr:HAMP domain-containing sensor histidine kinase [Desulforhopalus singaporensis]SDP82940.1 Histidine kinase-, DNA gyrase B-, and HSP90-like ATPase [Desulforhopalus singaporensis]
MIPDTYFAPAARSSAEQLKKEIEITAKSPVVNLLMTTIGGLFAIVNENRQIVALNEVLVKMLGLESAEQVFGARPGEALNCVYSSELPGGCGTTKACRTCGAVIALLSSLDLNQPVDGKCNVLVDRNGENVTLHLGVRAAPIELSQHKFLLFFIQDLSTQQQLATLERTFFHDINNVLNGLVGYLNLLCPMCEGKARKFADRGARLADIVCREISYQKSIADDDANEIKAINHEISVDSLIEEACSSIWTHPAAKKKTVERVPLSQDWKIWSDQHLITKVLINMLLNALEAVEEGETVKISAEMTDGAKTLFSVWNSTVISEDIQKWIFQKNFTTSREKGRGLGTYSMKFFGEEVLRGEVNFTSDPENGTTFYLKI